MTIDLTGGLALSREDVFVTAPDDPDMREGVTIWLHDDQGRFSLPRFGVEATSASWASPAVQANMAFADGRVLFGSCVGDAHSPYDADGKPAVIGAGPIEFRCVEPFRRWTLTWLGDALDTSITDQVAGHVPDGPRVEVEIHVDMTMAVPPWIQGEMGEDAARRMAAGKESLFMGGARYEGDKLQPATVLEAPWMTQFQAEGGSVPVTLETADGVQHIAGATTTSTAISGTASLSKVAAMSSGKARHSLFFHQGGALYTWNGEQAYGMIERSLPVAQVQR